MHYRKRIKGCDSEIHPEPRLIHPGDCCADHLVFLADLCKYITRRENLIKYPPAIYCTSSRHHLDNIQIQNAWDGIFAIGSGGHYNIGGLFLGRIEIGAYNKGLVLKNAYDFVHAESLHFWPFGISENPNGLSIYQDGNTIALSVEGVLDGIAIDKLATFTAKVIWNESSNSAIGNTINVAQMDADGACWDHRNGRLIIATMYKTSASEINPWINIPSGRLHVGYYHAIGNGRSDRIIVSGDGILMINGGWLNHVGESRLLRVDSGFCEVRNSRIIPYGIHRSLPLIEQFNGALLISNSEITEKVGGGEFSGLAVKFNSDRRYSGLKNTNSVYEVQYPANSQYLIKS